MEYILALLLFVVNFFLYPGRLLSLPLCMNSRAPSDADLGFCPYKGSTCCNSSEDLQLSRQFDAMKIPNSSCGSVMKSLLCARCDPFSAQLFTSTSAERPIPVLCNSTRTSSSHQSSQALKDFCSETWERCGNVSVLNSPFIPFLRSPSVSLLHANSTKLTDLWQSKGIFCKALGGASSEGSLCYSGDPVEIAKIGTRNPPHGVCLEKIGNGSYLDMAAHPDGSDHAFLSNQRGKIWLAQIPKEGSGATIGIEESNPFIDLTDEVYYSATFGMMAIAFHPKFAQNGRFFVSYNCDKSIQPNCSGRCSCNSDVKCDPSKLSSDDTSQPCQYQAVVAEYTANGTAKDPSSAESAIPLEVRRILTMGLPFTSHHGGQILFGPGDGYLYFMMGDGGGKGDPYNFSQNKKSLLGKILRLDVDRFPSADTIDKLGLWGEYSIPKDNAFTLDHEMLPEIWALGLRNPWRCSFDSERPSYFMCADVGEDTFEEVDAITKGGNYGWPYFEGSYSFKELPIQNSSLDRNNFIFPVMGYNHSVVNKNEGSASITGGYIYRSKTDPCLYGRYLYADLYATAMWAATETPPSSGNFTSNEIPFSCAKDSPIDCISVAGSSLPSLGYIYSFGQDNSRDVFILTSNGVYRVVHPSRCNYTCSVDTAAASAGPAPSPGSLSNSATVIIHASACGKPATLLLFWLLLKLFF